MDRPSFLQSATLGATGAGAATSLAAVGPTAAARTTSIPQTKAVGEPVTRRWLEQRWVIDNVIKANGIDWDQPRSVYLNSPCGLGADGDFAAIRQRVQKYADISSASEAGARLREAKAREAQTAQDVVTKDIMSTSTAARSALLLAGAALFCSLTSCKAAKSSTPPPAEVSVIRVQPQTVDALATVPGRTVAFRVAEIRPQVSGVLLKRMFEEGTEVAEGQQLYQIDPAPYQAAYDKAQGTLLHDQAALVYARAHAARWGTLTHDAWASKEDNDQAVSAAGEAEADVKVDQATVEAAAINLNYTKMASPISGRISRSAVTEGALVTANQATVLATVRQLDPIYVDVTQSSADLLPLRRRLQDKNLSANSGLSIPVDLTLEDGRSYGLAGKLSFSEVNVDEGTGTTTLRAIFPNPNRLLLPGMYVRATLHEGTHENAYLVAQGAVQRNIHADPYLYVVNQKDEVEERLIQIDGSQGNDWVVVKGLNPGDRIITVGLQQVTPGAHVHPTEAAPQADQ